MVLLTEVSLGELRAGLWAFWIKVVSTEQVGTTLQMTTLQTDAHRTTKIARSGHWSGTILTSIVAILNLSLILYLNRKS